MLPSALFKLTWCLLTPRQKAIKAIAHPEHSCPEANDPLQGLRPSSGQADQLCPSPPPTTPGTKWSSKPAPCSRTSTSCPMEIRLRLGNGLVAASMGFFQGWGPQASLIPSHHHQHALRRRRGGNWKIREGKGGRAACSKVRMILNPGLLVVLDRFAAWCLPRLQMTASPSFVPCIYTRGPHDTVLGPGLCPSCMHSR